MTKYKILAGISISLLAAMLIASCGDTQTASKGESSMPVSSAAVESVVPSDVVSDEASSQKVSSAAASSSKVTSSKVTSSKVASSKVTSSKVTPSEPFATYSLTKRESIQNGEDLAIVVGKTMETIASPGPIYHNYESFTFVPVTNTTELNNFKSTINDTFHDYSKYNTQFFQENTLIALFIPYLSSSFSTQVKSFVKLGDELCIEVITNTPDSNVVNDDVHFRFILIEVKTASISGVKKIGCHENFQLY